MHGSQPRVDGHRKNVTESLLLDGELAEWLTRARQTMEAQSYRRVPSMTRSASESA